MIIIFRRTGQRRYAVEAQRDGFPDLEMNPAPGFDSLMPHDLMHLIVEAQLGLTRGVFGQLAAGGDAGTFHLRVRSDESSREVTRTRNRVMARGKRLRREGKDDLAQSERATYICWQEWLARSSSRKRRQVSDVMAQQAREVRDVANAAELRVLNRNQLDDICNHLDRLSSHWSGLEVGESMAVAWPDLEIVSESSQRNELVSHANA